MDTLQLIMLKTKEGGPIMDKRKYEKPEMEILAFESEDMIVASVELPDDDWYKRELLGVGLDC